MNESLQTTHVYCTLCVKKKKKKKRAPRATQASTEQRTKSSQQRSRTRREKSKHACHDYSLLLPTRLLLPPKESRLRRSPWKEKARVEELLRQSASARTPPRPDWPAVWPAVPSPPVLVLPHLALAKTPPIARYYEVKRGEEEGFLEKKETDLLELDIALGKPADGAVGESAPPAHLLLLEHLDLLALVEGQVARVAGLPRVGGRCDAQHLLGALRHGGSRGRG